MKTNSIKWITEQVCEVVLQENIDGAEINFKVQNIQLTDPKICEELEIVVIHLN